MATADLTVLALGRADVSASAYIAAIQRRLALVGDLQEVVFDEGVPRVYTVLKLDERRDRPGQTLDDKVASVRARL